MQLLHQLQSIYVGHHHIGDEQVHCIVPNFFQGQLAAGDKYGTQMAVLMNPGATLYIAVAFDAPSSERTFTIIPGMLVVSWSGDITFTLP